MNKYPIISIIIATYNAERTLEETLKSIVCQDYKNIELIIVDGVSTDATLDIIQRYNKIVATLISEPDKGIYDAMNKGLGIASGDWCLFLGADDILYDKNVISKAVNCFVKSDTIYYGDVIMKSTKKVYHGLIKSATDFCRRNICHQSIFYPRTIYKNKKYNLIYPMWADYVYNLELYSEDPSKFVYIAQTISIFDDNGASKNGDGIFKDNRFRITKDLFGLKMALKIWFGSKIKSLFR